MARHLRHKFLEICNETGAVLGVYYQGFQLRPEKQEKGLSVNHLEHFQGSQIAQLQGIKAEMTNCGFGVGGKSAYAVLQAKVYEDCAKQHSVSLAAFKKPLPGNGSHAEVLGLPVDNSNVKLLEELAREASKSLTPAKALE